MSRYDIYMHNKPQEDTTPISSSSPQTNNTSSPSLATKGNIALTYGAVAAVKTYRTAVQEVKARGNERLAVQMSNAANVASRVGLIVGTKGIAAIPMVIEGAFDIATTVWERERENKQIEIENSLRGRRNKFGGGLGG